MQAILSQVDIHDAGLKAEAIEMIKLAERLAKCLTEYFLAKEFTNNKFNSLIASHLMTKYFQMKTWKFAPVNERKDLPNYKMTVEFVSDEKLIITVEHSKGKQNEGEEMKSFITLVVGDTENNLLMHSEDM